jgi:hypothetical protein
VQKLLGAIRGDSSPVYAPPLRATASLAPRELGRA